MGNISSKHKYHRLKTTDLEKTGFQNYAEVSAKIFGAKIEYVTDESFGEALNLLKPEPVDRDLIIIDNEENTHGWLTKRHEKVASAAITLCNDSKIIGFDIDTTGYVDCAPSLANIEGYSQIDFKWHTLVANEHIKADSHNFFELKTDYHFSTVRLNVTPGGGVARFRTYGDISPNWSEGNNEYNLASASLGAQIVRWTDQRSANSKNILLDHGSTIADGWLTPRSKPGQDRNDYIIIKLATEGKLDSIVVDTSGFQYNSPSKITIQGCYSNDIDPYYAPTNWLNLVTHADVLPGNYTFFEVDTNETITHIRVFIVPDGGIQQISVIGKPVLKKKKSMFLIEAQPEIKIEEANESSENSDIDENESKEEADESFDRKMEYILKKKKESIDIERQKGKNSQSKKGIESTNDIKQIISEHTETVLTNITDIKIKEEVDEQAPRKRSLNEPSPPPSSKRGRGRPTKKDY